MFSNIQLLAFWWFFAGFCCFSWLFHRTGGVSAQAVRFSLVDVAAALMKVSPDEFLQAENVVLTAKVAEKLHENKEQHGRTTCSTWNEMNILHCTFELAAPMILGVRKMVPFSKVSRWGRLADSHGATSSAATSFRQSIHQVVFMSSPRGSLKKHHILRQISTLRDQAGERSAEQWQWVRQKCETLSIFYSTNLRSENWLVVCEMDDLLCQGLALYMASDVVEHMGEPAISESRAMSYGGMGQRGEYGSIWTWPAWLDNYYFTQCIMDYKVRYYSIANYINIKIYINIIQH